MKRTKKIILYCNEKEKQQIQANATNLGYSLSGYLRTLGSSRVWHPGEIQQLPQITIKEKKHKLGNKYFKGGPTETASVNDK